MITKQENAVIAQEDAQITITIKGEVKEPIIIRRNPENTQFDNTTIIAEPNSKATIIEIIQGNPETHNHVVQVEVQENAKINYTSVQDLDLESIHHSVKTASVHKNAEMNWFNALIGAKQATVEVSSHLNQEGAKTSNNGLFYGAENQKYELNSKSLHKSSKTRSNMLFKGALNHQAKATFVGLTDIGKENSKCEGHQKEDTLLLSKDAKAKAIPRLKIRNSDVKCNHSASIGRVDEDKIFYLMSRGLTRQEAVKQLVLGFFGTVLIPQVKDIVLKRVEERS